MENIVLICFSLFYRLTWVRRCWPRAAPDFGSVSVISSFLPQDIRRHPDTRLFEVREAFKRSLLLEFEAHIRAYIAFFRLRGPTGGAPGPLPGGPPAAPSGGLRATRHALPVELRVTDAEPQINVLVQTGRASCRAVHEPLVRYSEGTSSKTTSA